jgi:hypothetical protein
LTGNWRVLSKEAAATPLSDSPTHATRDET